MTTPTPPSPSKAVLVCSAIICLGLFVTAVYLLWRGPPSATFLARHSYLKEGMIFYPLFAILAIAFGGIGLSNIKQLLQN